MDCAAAAMHSTARATAYTALLPCGTVLSQSNNLTANNKSNQLHALVMIVLALLQLVMMTPGVLLKKLNGDPQLRQYTHIVIDEVRSNSSVIILVIVQF
jgi:hypothetical protein